MKSSTNMIRNQRAESPRVKSRMLKVLIADDHAIVRKGLREILREAAETTVVGEAKNGEEALAKAASEAWDVVVLDITMPGASGLEVLKALKQRQPALPVLMLSMHSGYHYVTGSLKAGASGYLNKETAPEELVTAIHTVIEGGIYVSRGLAEAFNLGNLGPER
jgi:two-component system invasion response regulator UvrY